MNEYLRQLYLEAGLQPAWQRQPEAQPGYTPPRPRPRTMRPAIARLYDPNQGVRDQAAAQVRRERELAANVPRALGGASGFPDRDQIAETGMNYMEMTGAPSLARGVQHVGRGEPGEAIPELLMGGLGALGMATLPYGGGAYAAATRQPMGMAPRPPAAPMPPIRPPVQPLPARAPDGGASGAGNRVVYRGLNRPYDPTNGGYYQSFTSSLDDAREYGPNVIAAHINPGRNLAIDGGGNNFNALSVEQLPADVRARLHPSVGASATTDQIAHAAREAGYDSVTVRNVHDNRWGERPVRGAEPRTIDFVFDTRNISPLDSIPEQPTTAAQTAERVRLSDADRALLDELEADLRAPDAPNAGPPRPPPRLPGRASDGSVLPIRPPEPFRNSMRGGSDDLVNAARGELDQWEGGFYHASPNEFDAFDPTRSPHRDHIGTFFSPREAAVRGQYGNNIYQSEIRAGRYITPAEFNRRVDARIASERTSDPTEVRRQLILELQSEGYLGIRGHELDEVQVFNSARDARIVGRSRYEPPTASPRDPVAERARALIRGGMRPSEARATAEAESISQSLVRGQSDALGGRTYTFSAGGGSDDLVDAARAPDAGSSGGGQALDAGAMTALRRELRDHDFDVPATMPALPEIEVPIGDLRQGRIGSLDRADASRYARMESEAPPLLVRRDRNGWHIIDGNRRAAASAIRGDRTVRALDASELFATRAPDGGAAGGETWYRGTAADKPLEPGLGGAIWLSDNADVANRYSADAYLRTRQRGQVYDFPQVQPRNPLEIDMRGEPIMALYGRLRRDLGVEGEYADVLRQVRERGHDAIVIRNVRDQYTPGGRGGPQTQLAVLDPAILGEPHVFGRPWRAPDAPNAGPSRPPPLPRPPPRREIGERTFATGQNEDGWRTYEFNSGNARYQVIMEPNDGDTISVNFTRSDRVGERGMFEEAGDRSPFQAAAVYRNVIAAVRQDARTNGAAEYGFFGTTAAQRSLYSRESVRQAFAPPPGYRLEMHGSPPQPYWVRGARNPAPPPRPRPPPMRPQR